MFELVAVVMVLAFGIDPKHNNFFAIIRWIIAHVEEIAIVILRQDLKRIQLVGLVVCFDPNLYMFFVLLCSYNNTVFYLQDKKG